MTASQGDPLKVQYVSVLVRADTLEYISDPNSEEPGAAPVYLDDSAHCPDCGKDVLSLYLAFRKGDDSFSYAPVCDQCYRPPAPGG